MIEITSAKPHHCTRCGNRHDAMTGVTNKGEKSAKTESELMGQRHINICYYCGLVSDFTVGEYSYKAFTEKDFEELKKADEEAYKLVVATSVAFETKWKIGRN